MYYIGSLFLSGYSIVSLQWYLVVSFAAPPLTFATYAAQRRFWHGVGRRVLRSAARDEFLVPRARLAIIQQRVFSVVGPSAWSDLPLELRSLLMAMCTLPNFTFL